MSTIVKFAEKIGCILLLTICVFTSHGQVEPPVLNCIQTDDLGNILVFWDIPEDPAGQFVNYHFWRMDDLSGFNSMEIAGSISDYNQNNIAWVGADALNTQRHFYLYTEWTDGSNNFNSANSDTLCNILLNVQASVPAGFAELSWSGPYTPTGAPPGAMYEVWRQDLSGWSMITTLPIDQFEYSDPVDGCNGLYSYQIRVPNLLAGCESSSNTVTDNFADSEAPDIPEVNFVTVNPETGNAAINWTPSSAPDTWGYIIYACDQWGEQPVDTVYGASINNFENINSNANTTSEYYIIAAFDSCMVGGNFLNLSPTNGNCNSTIFLSPPTFYSCQDFVTLNWSAYQGWSGGVGQYEILYSEDGGPLTIASTVDGNTLTFVHQNLTLGATYQYFIQAYASGLPFTSLSNAFTVNIQVDNSPTENYLMTATVVSDEEVMISVQTLPVILPHEYILERRNNNSPGYQFISSTLYNDLNPNPGIQSFTLFDVGLDTRYQEYEYRITVLNDCHDTVTVTNVGHTINLNGITNNGSMVNTLIWNPYTDWDGGVDYYNIYRSQAQGTPGSLIATVPAAQNFYEDDVADLYTTPGLFCYTVEAVESINSYGYAMSSVSNECCLQMDPIVWIPSAFMVYGFNPTFTPVVSFADEPFSMTIFSRWGDIIFQSDTLSKSWDGRMNGNLVPEGVYAYYMTIHDGRGKLHEYRGVVTMLIGSKE